MLRRLTLWLMNLVGINPQLGIVILCSSDEDALYTARPIGATISDDPDTIMECVLNGIHVVIPLHRTNSDYEFPIDVTVTTSLQTYYNEHRTDTKPKYMN